MPLISIIIPVYNCKQYLTQCIESVLAQKVADFEVIIINDGSTDGSDRICDAFASNDSRFTVVHKKNQGLSAARNDGLELARGQWVTFLDSDDWLEPHFLDVLIANHDVDYIVTSINHCRPADIRNSEKFVDNKYYNIDQSVFADCNMITAFFTAWSKFFNNKIIKKNNLRFIPGVSPGEDTIFVFQYLNCINSVYLSDIPCYNWRVANGLTNRKRTFEWIEYTIDHTMRAIEQVESRFNVDLSDIKYHSLNYLIDKIDVGRYSYRQLYLEIRKIASKSWMTDIITDRAYLIKGKRRNVLDYLLRRKAFFLSSLLCKQLNRLY